MSLTDKTTVAVDGKQWSIPHTLDGISVILLADIRSELKKLNSLLSCPNFTGIPKTLTSIRRNTAKPRKRKKVTR